MGTVEQYAKKCYNSIIDLFDKWYQSQWTALADTLSILSSNNESLAVTTAAIKSHGAMTPLVSTKSLHEHEKDVEKDIRAIEDSLLLIKNMFISMGISSSAASEYLTHLVMASDHQMDKRSTKIDIANELVDAWSNYIAYNNVEKSGSTVEKGYNNYMEMYRLQFFTALNELLPKTKFQNCLSTVASYKLEHQNQEQISQMLLAAELKPISSPTSSTPPVKKPTYTKNTKKYSQQKVLG